MHRFVEINKIALIFFTIFTLWGAFTFFVPKQDQFSISPNTTIIGRFLSTSPSPRYCIQNGYIETYSANFNVTHFYPITGLFYGNICNHSILFLVNIPFYYLLAFIGCWIMLRIQPTFKKRK